MNQSIPSRDTKDAVAAAHKSKWWPRIIWGIVSVHMLLFAWVLTWLYDRAVSTNYIGYTCGNMGELAVLGVVFVWEAAVLIQFFSALLALAYMIVKKHHLAKRAWTILMISFVMFFAVLYIVISLDTAIRHFIGHVCL